MNLLPNHILFLHHQNQKCRTWNLCTLETKDNNPIESNRIRREISILIKDIKREELKQPVSVERGKELFANMRRELDLDETISYKEFFDL